MTDYKKLKVWQLAIDYSLAIYSATEAFPKKELFGLTNQLRRSGVSIPSNIAEGSKRSSDKDFKHFIHMALGSCAENQTQIFISYQLAYITKNDFERLTQQIETLSSMLIALTKKLHSSV